MGFETQQSCNNYYSDVSSPSNTSSNNGTSSANNTNNNSNNNNSYNNNNNNSIEQSNSIMANYYQSVNNSNSSNSNRNASTQGHEGAQPGSPWNDQSTRNNIWNFQNMNQQYQRFYSESQNYNNLMAVAAANASQQNSHLQAQQEQQQQQQSQQQMHAIQTPSSALSTKRLYYSQGQCLDVSYRVFFCFFTLRLICDNNRNTCTRERDTYTHIHTRLSNKFQLFSLKKVTVLANDRRDVVFCVYNVSVHSFLCHTCEVCTGDA